MFTFLINCIKAFGLFNGLRIYIQIKILRVGKISMPGLKNPLIIRNGTADLNTFREIFIRKEYNISLPDNFQPTTIIDAGANIGFTSLFFSMRFPKAQIFSLEPDPDNFEMLVKNTKGYELITPVKTALYNKEGVIHLEDNGFGVRGYMVSEKESTSTGIELPATTLQNLLAKHNIKHIDILKMDIEGSEREVFVHAPEQWLAITSCVIVELHDRMKPGCSKAVFSALAKYNFSCDIKGENLVFINRDRY